MKRSTLLWIVGGLMFGAASLRADMLSLDLHLKEVEDAALQNSPKYQSAELDFKSSSVRTEAQQAGLFPKLSLEASYRYVSEVPKFQPVPNAPAVAFGDNKNYSIGPMMSWNAFTSGTLYNRYRSMSATSRAKYFDWESIGRQILLETRLDYFQVQLALEQVRLLADSLKLAESQHKDISLQWKAGTVSRIDELTAHQQVLLRARDLRQAQGDLAAALQNLFAVTGEGMNKNVSVPLDGRLKDDHLPETDPPTALVTVDPTESSKIILKESAARSPDLDHPNIQSLTESARSARLLAESLQGGHGPSVNVTAKTSRDYPNGPVLEAIHQNTIGVTASWPLFEAGRVVKEVRAQKETAGATEKRRDQAILDLKRDFGKAEDALQSLRYQDSLNTRLVEENESLVKLVYESYRAGRSNYLDVEAADLRLLETKVASARTRVQILMQLAILDSLSVPVD